LVERRGFVGFGGGGEVGWKLFQKLEEGDRGEHGFAWDRMMDENALRLESKSIPFPVVCVSPTNVFSISSDDLSNQKNGNSLFGLAVSQKLNGSYRSVSNESGVDDRDLDIVLHVSVVSPHSFPQGPCKTERCRNKRGSRLCCPVHMMGDIGVGGW